MKWIVLIVVLVALYCLNFAVEADRREKAAEMQRKLMNLTSEQP